MMKILYYDCFAGISGDMHLGAMIDAGVDPEYLLQELKKLPVGGFTLKISRDVRGGIEGTRVVVTVENDNDQFDQGHSHGPGNDHQFDQGHSHGHGHKHDHKHDHGHKHDHDLDHGHSHVHDHDHNHGHSHNLGHDHDHRHTPNTEPDATRGSDKPHDHVHRNLHDIEQIVSDSRLGERVKKRAMKMFMLIARAESKIHGVPVDKIHFHEVGALDSIVDVVGAAICIEYLNPDLIMSSTVELGSGMIRCAHGIMPVPAPATAEILKDIPVKLGTTPHEATTPTGAAILAANVDQFTDHIRFFPSHTAYGIGGRDMEIPNVLRVYMGETEDLEIRDRESVIIECNIDDMNPELYSHIMDQLFSRGADDVYMTPVIMKKSRPAVKLSVLCSRSLEQAMTETILLQTTSLGVRSYYAGKHMLQRKIETVSTSLGGLKVKKALYKGRLLKWKVEYEDCRKMADKHNLSILEVYRVVTSEIGDIDKTDTDTDTDTDIDIDIDKIGETS